MKGRNKRRRKKKKKLILISIADAHSFIFQFYKLLTKHNLFCNLFFLLSHRVYADIRQRIATGVDYCFQNVFNVHTTVQTYAELCT